MPAGGGASGASKFLPGWVRGEHLGLAACFVFLLWANVVTPLWADDYCNALDASPLTSLATAWHFYFAWTGRFVAVALGFVALGTGWRWSMLPFDLVNALVFVGLISLVLRLAGIAGGRDGPARRSRLAGFCDALFAALLIWWSPHSVAEAALWKTGSIVYLWAVTGELLILERALAWTERGRTPPPLWLAAPFAFAMATFLEPLSATMSAALCVVALRAWRRGQPWRWLAAVAASHAAGLVVLVASPGTYVRAADVAKIIPPSPLADRLDNLRTVFARLLDGYTCAALALIVLAVMLPEGWLRRTRGGLAAASDQAPTRLRVAVWCGFLAMTVLYVLTLLAIPPVMVQPRVEFPASVLFGCAIVTLFRLRPATPARNAVVAAILVVLAMASVVVVVRDLRVIAAKDRAATRVLAHAPPGGDVTVPAIRFDGYFGMSRKHRYVQSITDDPGYWVNVCYAKAWGMRSITGK